MRLIDADALLSDIERTIEESGCVNHEGEIIDCVQYAPTIDAVQAVRCGECIWWQDRQIQLSDGSCRDYLPNEPWSVTSDVGINIGSHCTKHGFEDESGSWFWANAEDFCSHGEMEGKP